MSVWQIKPIHASLFGSLARDGGEIGSDIDVLLVRPDELTEDESPWADQMDKLRHSVRRWTGNDCHTFQVSSTRLTEYHRTGDPLIDNWLRDAITLFGAELSELLTTPPAIGNVE